MSQTNVIDVANQVQEFWSPLFMDEFFESNILATLVNKDYEGELKKKGDTVYVSQINVPTGQRNQVGSGHDTYSTEKLSTSRVSLVANQVISAAYEFEDLVEIQSQIGDKDSKIREGLLKAVSKQVNDYLYSLVAPSAAAPDHITTGVADFNATQTLAARKLASQAHWPKEDRYLLLDPSYYNDVLAATTMTSNDYVDDRAVVGGQVVTKRFGWNIIEDDSAGLAGLGTSGEDCALGFNPDFLLMAMQRAPEFKISDLHSNKQFGYVISVRLIMGAVQGIDGDVKHLTVINS